MTATNSTDLLAVRMFHRDGSPAPERQASQLSRGTFHWTSNLLEPCHRCGGQGGSDAWRHTGWVCYECNGAKELYYSRKNFSYTAEKLAAMIAAQIRVEAKRVERQRAAEEAELAARCRQRKESHHHNWRFAKVNVTVGKPLAAFR